jgi:hypothetical protein
VSHIIASPASDAVAAESVNWTGANIIYGLKGATAWLTLQLRGCGTSLLSPEALRSHLCDKNKVREGELNARAAVCSVFQRRRCGVLSEIGMRSESKSGAHLFLAVPPRFNICFYLN